MKVAEMLGIMAKRLSFVSDAKTLNKQRYKILEVVISDLFNLSNTEELNNLSGGDLNQITVDKDIFEDVISGLFNIPNTEEEKQ